MELAILASMGLVGYYLNTNDENKKKESIDKIKTANIPNGFDIYNQNRLALSEEHMRDAAEKTFNKSQFPTKTNIIPDYWNQLSPLLNKTKFNAPVKYDRVATLYNVEDDLDDVYSDFTFKPDTPIDNNNSIFKKPYFERNSPLLSDLYENNNQVKKRVGNIGSDMLEKKEKFQNIDDGKLLDVSEQLTDNADSIRKILRENVNKMDDSEDIPSNCDRKETREDLVRKSKLIGTTADYKRILVDDQNAKFPNPKSDRELTLPPADFPEFLGRCTNPEIINCNKENKNINAHPGVLHDQSSSKQRPGYLSQFDLQTYDSKGLPGSVNDTYDTNDKAKLADMERKLSYQGGWSQYDNAGSMSYGIVPDDQLVHDNMVPFFKNKGGYGSNDLHNNHVMNYKNELFTGNLVSSWNKKQEVRPLFAPVADMSYVYGTPVRREEEDSRYIPSLYRQNEKLFDEVRVTPGLNLDYNEIGTQGNFDLYRALPKTVDELRIKTDQKITYEGRIIEGRKGSERPVQAPVISYRPDGFKVTTEADYLPKTDVNTGPRTRENFVMKETDRALQHVEYTGPGFAVTESAGKNVPESMREKYKYSDKQNFTLPKPLQRFAKDETMYNPNLGSYDLPYTARSQTGNTNYTGAALSGHHTYANPTDVARHTLKEIESVKSYNRGPATPNVLYGTTPYMDAARQTIKETTAALSLNPNAPTLNTQQRVYHPDIARATIRETTADHVEPINTTQYGKTYSNLSDVARITLKEQIAEIPQTVTQIFAVDQAQGKAYLQDIARTTVKEGTVQIPYQTMVTPVDQQRPTTQNQDIARTTTREGTVQIPYETFVTGVDQQRPTPHHQDITRTTIKEGTVQIPYQTMVTPIDQQRPTSHYQDIARTTTREGTVQIPYETIVTGVNQQRPTTQYQDIARTTTREGTVQIPYETFVTGVDQQRPTAQYQDTARTTIREGTVQIPYETIVTGVNQQRPTTHHQDVARTTIKEGTVQIPYQTMVYGVDQTAPSAYYQDVAKTTTKESTVQIPYNTNTTAVEQQQGQASGFNRTPLRATVKETTIDNDYIGGPTNDVNAKGYGYISADAYAPNTNRQFTSQEVYVPPAQADAKARSYNDAYNSQMDDRKEILHWYRPPTASGVNLGPIKEQMNVFLKNDDNRMPGPNPVYSVNNNLDRPDFEQTTRTRDNIQMNLFIDPGVLKQLESNPYNIPYYGTHYG